MKIFKDEIFQGNLKSKDYFEGWYFKNISDDGKSIYSIIAGVSLHEDDKHAFIQIINGITSQTYYIRYDIKDFYYDKKLFFVTIGENQFSRDFISLNIDDEKIKIFGGINYADHVLYPKSLISPGIMGWFSYIPFMECNHGVVSVNSKTSGLLNVNGEEVIFDGGHAYMEKDWGKSFPDSWVWLQCNTFKEEGNSLFLSIANIPFIGFKFKGFISFLYSNGKFYKFSTYNCSKIIETDYNDGRLKAVLKNSKYKLEISAEMVDGGELIAPVSGKMERVIKESVLSNISFVLTDKKGAVIEKGEGKSAGLEICNYERLLG